MKTTELKSLIESESSVESITEMMLGMTGGESNFTEAKESYLNKYGEKVSDVSSAAILEKPEAEKLAKSYKGKTTIVPEKNGKNYLVLVSS
ncbi:hypothetical protein Molly5_35 [Maribacter phage Molly_5]|uniref:Uncharacterized protein n=2 Tax=Mollyvirus TaxID=2948826 RepID=A0A8E4UXY4_9CAUD|nr:hypothetical protein M1M29_gp035 [Maribacter phage Molly_1]YP_010357283.1 hypothetical protein M1M30_gp034 [Maribacter phage Colly_1]QQO97717.1 hypothetical protein Molly2_35 [Maribacter phage Molly_2]QQO97917.1 hypothetical protein Molly3_35 [Maribacter phage Molly_3]QQO98117.1 hypothetical protein Molly4_35 [Maribacter phage Molly_4]QQO98317.1 hypothetical protein Molly5_35 [Maribacter phage Molly_5]QQO97316.1 hypothetical protein Colly1_34 [Maribacter phage Colly_1]